MTEFDLNYTQCQNMLIDADKYLKKIETMVGNQRAEALYQMNQRFTVMNNQIVLVNTELQFIVDSVERDTCAQKATILENELEELRHRHREMSKMKSASQANGQDTVDQEEKPVQLTETNKLQAASLLYDDAKNNLTDADRALTEVVTINDEITNVLAADLQKLNRIQDNLTDITSDVEIAKKQLRELAKRITSNKLYQGIFILVLLGVVGLSVWDITKSAKK